MHFKLCMFNNIAWHNILQYKKLHVLHIFMICLVNPAKTWAVPIYHRCPSETLNPNLLFIKKWEKNTTF